MGIVERIECDPNFPSQIALVRWIKGVLLPIRRTYYNMREEFSLLCGILEPTMTTIDSLFYFSSLPGRVDEMKDVFLLVLSSPRARREATTSPSFGSSLGLPRIEVVGAKLASSAL
eukprot:Gb_28019 [translate_table: standard]